MKSYWREIIDYLQCSDTRLNTGCLLAEINKNLQIMKKYIKSVKGDY